MTDFHLTAFCTPNLLRSSNAMYTALYWLALILLTVGLLFQYGVEFNAVMDAEKNASLAVMSGILATVGALLSAALVTSVFITVRVAIEAIAIIFDIAESGRRCEDALVALVERSDN